MPSGPALLMGGGTAGPTIPGDYVGLSYEAAQLANPDFFSPGNTALIRLFRELSPSGNLRIGGGSSEYTTFSEKAAAGPPPFEVFGPDTSKTVKHGTTTSALALRNLRGFLDATGWSCLYGLNLGQGTKDNAAAEAAAVQHILGARLTAVQIGNEPDSFRKRYRPAEWGPEDFLREWNSFHDAIAASAPGIRFAGPDISNKLPFLTAFAREAPRHQDLVLLTGHYYAMGPAGSPEATLAQLLAPDPTTATMHLADLPTVDAAIAGSRLPFRLSEGNSCWDGGKPGVSNTLASALWCADAMLRFAQRGWAGVNWHGGGNGWYTPIAGAPSTGFQRRPEFYGIRFAQMLVGATYLPTRLDGAGDRVSAYALRREGKLLVAIVNKTDQPVAVALPARTDRRATLLTGPSLDSTEGVTLGTIAVPLNRTAHVPSHSAMMFGLAD